jgi:hypothetical protein
MAGGTWREIEARNAPVFSPDSEADAADLEQPRRAGRGATRATRTTLEDASWF